MPPPSKPAVKKVPAVSVEHCTVSFNDDVILDDISFDVEQGKIAAVIGPNGSGKTTLIRAILGLTPMRSGEIRVFGKHLHAMRTMIGYVPQRFNFDRNFPITVNEFMELARRQHCPRPRIKEKIEEVGLAASILESQLGSLSGGQLQRVLMAQDMLNNPAILFLDEPSSGIDIVGEATFYEIIHHLNIEHQTTILLVSHDIAMISDLVDAVICVNRKLLCSGAPQIALTKKKLTELFGARTDFYEHPGHHEHKGH